MRKGWFLCAAFLATGASLSAQSDWDYWQRSYQPESWAADSIAYVLEEAEDDEVVYLEGQLSVAEDDGTFILSDEDGEILVEMPGEGRYLRSDIGLEGATVRIIGEVDIESEGEVVVDAEWYTFLTEDSSAFDRSQGSADRSWGSSSRMGSWGSSSHMGENSSDCCQMAR